MTDALKVLKPRDQMDLPLPLDIEKQAHDASRRLQEFINRSAGQHMRALRKSWAPSQPGNEK